jgi:hypothetical protein
MADLSGAEKRKLEKLFGMSSGYVLDFSNRTFEEFVDEHTGRKIYEPVYMIGSGSKANCLRGFWAHESNYLVGRLIGALIDYGHETGAFKNDGNLPEDCRGIVERLAQQSTVPEIDALIATADGRDFETLAVQVRDAITKNQPQAALDRLHTFVIKYMRILCEQHGLTVTREKPLHSLFGEYFKKLRDGGHLESKMTAHILKSSISVMEAFNDVRNGQSLAHDNVVLNYDESLLIFNHVANTVRFLRGLEARIKAAKPAPDDTFSDDIPF